jgi:carbamoyl-phosphate synthase small subunit
MDVTWEPFYLLLENGEQFKGYSSKERKGKSCVGEVVFTTGMTGYTESLTDPSYHGQILSFTYPLIGNYGVTDASLWESEKIHAKAVIVSKCAPFYSHFQGQSSLLQWLDKQNIFLLTDVDTRALTKVLRGNGTLRGLISENPSMDFFKNSPQVPGKIKREERQFYGKGKKRILAIDFGMKEGMLQQLLRFPVEVLRVSSDYDYSQEEYDALFLSNGPSDPMEYRQEITFLKKAMERETPIFGVCLGCQLLALACGGNTYKLKYGHRGHNQPCMNLQTKACYITSQNHGYAIDKNSLPEGWEITFKNLNDESVEGIAHKEKPFSAVQFHPEAKPGPTDSHFLFETFIAQIGL